MDHAERDIEAPALPAGVGTDTAVSEVPELERLDGRLGEVFRGGFRDTKHSRLVHQVAPGRGLGVGAAGLRDEANALPHLLGVAPEVHPGDRGVATVRDRKSTRLN